MIETKGSVTIVNSNSFERKDGKHEHIIFSSIYYMYSI